MKKDSKQENKDIEKSNIEKRAEAYIEVISLFVQSITQFSSSSKGVSSKEISYFSMFHGIVAFFWSVNKAQANKNIDNVSATTLKTLVLSYYAFASLDKDNATYKEIENFAKLIYDLEAQCGIDKMEGLEEASDCLSKSLCKMLSLNNEKVVVDSFNRIISNFDSSLLKPINE